MSGAPAPAPQPCKTAPGTPRDRGTPGAWPRGPALCTRHPAPSPWPAVPASGLGAPQNPAGLGKAVNASGVGGAQAAPGGPPKPSCGCAWAREEAAAHLLTACGRRRRTETMRGEGQNRTEENSEDISCHRGRPHPQGASHERGRDRSGVRLTDRGGGAVGSRTHTCGHVHTGHACVVR